MNNQTQLNTGGDPRALSDYVALRDELAKLNHPARPDVNWQQVEQLSQSLFSQNGVELQTLSWYTLARTHLAGMAGLNEGLAILEKLLTHHWGTIWPQPVHARMEILAGFSKRLQSILRTFIFHYADLPQIYQAEQHLNVLSDMLQRLELKNASQIGALCIFMHNTATQLENMDLGEGGQAAVVLPETASHKETTHSESVSATDVPRKEMTHSEPASGATAPDKMLTHSESVSVITAPKGVWRTFAAGMLTMLVVGGGILWGVYKIYLLPGSPEPGMTNTVPLAAQVPLPPQWCQNYDGLTLVSRGEPVDADKLQAQWQHFLADNAVSQDPVSGWSQGMEGLQDLTRRLNALDERKGKYLTGSELKSMVFTIMQNFGRSVPVEEQLYQLSQTASGTPAPATLLLQTDIHLNQLLNRYARIKQQVVTP